MSTQFDDLKKMVEAAQADFEKFYDKGVGAAGARVRKHCQDITNKCKEVRKDVTEVKTARKEAKGS